MQRLTRSERTRNLGGGESCRWCANEGMLIVETLMPPYGEQAGPCPYCERGYEVEFPTPNPKAARPVQHGPWGPEGFWRGKTTAELTPIYGSDPKLSKEENALRLGVLSGRISKIGEWTNE